MWGGACLLGYHHCFGVKDIIIQSEYVYVTYYQMVCIVDMMLGSELPSRVSYKVFEKTF